MLFDVTPDGAAAVSGAPIELSVAQLQSIAAGNITPEMLREPEPRQESIVPDADNEATFRAPQFGLVDREL